MYIISLISVVILLFAAATVQESVKLTLYYESMCPYSQEFVNKQLYPSYILLGSALNVDVVPYGKATRKYVNGTWEFNCQHGPKECFGNKIQACVLYENSVDETVEFVSCIMGKPKPYSEDSAKQCTLENDVISWEKLQKCFSGKLGDEYLAELGSRTDKIKLTYVPNIWFNDKHNKTLESEARDDLMKVVCGLLKNKPAIC